MNQTNQIAQTDSGSSTAVINLTAIWAFSEGFLGGILNALKIPFKGLFLGSVAVIVITLIAGFSDKKGIILRTGIIVMIVKAILSPYTSVPAYFAVFVQTILGELFFLNRNFVTVPAILLGVITSVLSSIQRVIILTLVFGNALWETIDQFGGYIYNEFFGGKTVPADFKPSNWLIGIYIGIHAVVGFFVGLYASRLVKKIKSENTGEEKFLKGFRDQIFSNEKEVLPQVTKKKNKFFKFSKIILYLFLITVLILSYLLSDKGYFDSKSVWIMLIRSVIIMVLWFKILSPFLRVLLRSRLLKKRNKYSEDIHRVISTFPLIRKLISYAWRTSQGKGIKKISNFILIVIPVLLKFDFEDSEFLKINLQETS